MAAKGVTSLSMWLLDGLIVRSRGLRITPPFIPDENALIAAKQFGS